MLPITQVGPPPETEAPEGLRERKKERTRLAIEDAALELFADRGFDATSVEDIAERAEVSKATFFRYFSGKGAVIFEGTGYHHDALHDAIVARPPEEDDLAAVRAALQEQWVPLLDPLRVSRQGRACATSPLLRGFSTDLAVRWQGVISRAIAQRHGNAHADQRCWLVAGMVQAACSNATNAWIHGGERGELRDAIDHAFELMADVCREACTPTTASSAPGGRRLPDLGSLRRPAR